LGGQEEEEGRKRRRRIGVRGSPVEGEREEGGERRLTPEELIMQQSIAQFLFFLVVQTSFFEILKKNLWPIQSAPLCESRTARLTSSLEKKRFVFFEAVPIFGFLWWCQLDFERF